MTLSIWISYTIACILIITSPGPTVTYLITTSMTHGKKIAYHIVWGSFWGGLLCLILSFIGLEALLKTSETLYTTLRLLGFSYLIYLGIKSFLDAHQAKTTSPKKVPLQEKEAFKNGFLLVFLNSKNIIFFASSLPQFINNKTAFLPQAMILSLTYLAIGLINDYLYSFFASNIGNALGKESEKWMAYIGGTAIIASAIIVIFQNF